MKLPKIVIDAEAEPLTLDECRLHLRVDPTDGDTHPDDDLIMALQTAARQHCENYLGLSLVTKTLEIALDEFPTEDDGAIELPMGPVNAIISVTVGEDSDALQDEDTYVLDEFSVPNRLIPVSEWPTATASTNNIRIIYIVGYDASNSSDGPTIPRTIMQAIKLLLADWYNHREDTSYDRLSAIPNGVKTLLDLHRIRTGAA